MNPFMIRRTVSAIFLLPLMALTLLAAETDLEIAVQTDSTFLGEQQASPDPELNPVYYQFLTRGYVLFGTARPGDEDPEREALLQHLVAALRPLGYLPADADHRPRVAFMVLWGSAFGEDGHAREFLNTEKLPLKWEPRPSKAIRKNERLRDNFPDMPGDLLSRVHRLSFDDCYLLALTACDWKNASQGREVPLWQVRAFARARQTTADEAFHRMIDALAPDFLQPTDYPRLVKAPARWTDRALHFGFAESTDMPAPVDLTALVAHDFGADR